MISITWSILCESAIYLLVGLALAGLLEALVSGERVMRFLRGTRKRTVLLATMIGIPLPLCSCSVLPTAVTLRKKGAGKGATVSFLISTPETSVTSILLTYSLLGPLMAIYRPIAAGLTALTAGLVENALEKRFSPSPTAGADEPSSDASGESSSKDELAGHTHNHGPPPAAGSITDRLRPAMRYAFVDLFDDIFGWVMVGIVAAAAIQAFLPPDVLSRILGGTLQSMLLMVVIGVPLYVCAEASTPIAAVLIAQAVDPGAALVFLLVGPATNIGALGVLHRELGRRTVVVYLATIILVALLMGAFLNGIVQSETLALDTRVLDEPLLPAWPKAVGAIAFLVLGVGTLRRGQWLQRSADWLNARLPLPISAGGLKIATVVMAIVAYIGSGLFVIRPGEVGVVRRFDAIKRADLQPGLHYALPYPIERLDRVEIRRVHRMLIGLGGVDESWSLVGDENIADIKLSVHWGPVEHEVVRYLYGVADQKHLIRNVVLAASREVLGGVSINSVFTGDRRRCELAIGELAQAKLEAYRSGIRLRAVNMLDAHAPTDVHEAFRDVASALEDRAKKINKAQAFEARELPSSRGAAARQLAEAEAYAAETVFAARGEAAAFLSLLRVYREQPEVTRRRLELETMERVLPKLRKYIKPPTSEAAELDIWFLPGR